MFSKKPKKICVDTGRSQTGGVGWGENYNKESKRCVVYSNFKSKEFNPILSELIMEIIKSGTMDYNFYMNMADDLYDHDKDDIVTLLNSEGTVKYVFVVAGKDINKKYLFNYLVEKWHEDNLYQFLPKNVKFMMGPVTKDGDGYYFFIDKSLDDAFIKILLSLCEKYSLILEYDPRS